MLDTFAFEAHSPAMNKPAIIAATIVASFTFAGVAHANSDHEPDCGYNQVCEPPTDPTTTIVATDEPPVPSTTVAPPVTIGAINGPADVCDGFMFGGACVPREQRVLPAPIFLPVVDSTTTTAVIAVVDAAPALPATGAASTTVALIGLALLALAGLLYGVRWAFKR